MGLSSAQLIICIYVYLYKSQLNIGLTSAGLEINLSPQLNGAERRPADYAAEQKSA